MTRRRGPRRHSIVPKAYLGWSTQLREKAQLQMNTKLKAPEDHQHYRCDVAHFEANHRRLSTTDVVQGLWDMYGSGEPRSVCFFHEILAAKSYFWVEWVKAGGGREPLDTGYSARLSNEGYGGIE